MLPQSVLLTGAAGKIGRAFLRYAGDRYRFRLVDRTVDGLQDWAQACETMALDLANLDTCQAACQNIDTVIHLAADANPHADFYDSLLDNNIKGTYNIFRAAKDQGCQRVVYASSVHAILGYPTHTPVHPSMPVRPADLYGVSKCFGEALAAYFAYHEGLSSVAVRIGAFHEPNPQHQLRLESQQMFVSPRDLGQLIVQCIETPNVQFAIAHGISNNRCKRMDITATRAVFGYAPQDDAFAIFPQPSGGSEKTTA